MSCGRILNNLCRYSLQTQVFQTIRNLSLSSVHHKSIRDEQRIGTRMDSAQKEAFEGTTGAASHTAVNLRETFLDIPYQELPIVYIKATKNNTLVHATDFKNQAIAYTSCRLEGFKHAKKKTAIAGQTTGIAAGQRLLRRGINQIRVQVKGIGPGRMTCVKGLAISGINVISITDHTPLGELGPRPRKIRRI